MKQMVPREEGEEEDLLVQAFEQLAIAFKLKFDKAFDIKKEYKAKGCYAIHNHNCESRWEEDGYGGKKWVEVPSTCQQNNYDTCRDVQKQKLVQVPYTDCKNVPQQQCKQVPQQQCQQEPYTASQQVCEDVHRKIPQRISRTVPKKTCGGGASGGSGFGSAPSLPERQTSSGGGGGYRLTLFLGVFCPPNRLFCIL